MKACILMVEDDGSTLTLFDCRFSSQNITQQI